MNTFKLRQLSAVAVAALALEGILSGLARGTPHRQLLLGGQIPAGFPRGETHVLTVVLGLGLLALTPRLWRGTRMAASLAVIGLLALAAVKLSRSDYDEAVIECCLSGLLWFGRGAFPLGCRNRPRLAVVVAALAAWALAYCAMIVAPLAGPGHALQSLHHGPLTHALRSSALQLNAVWSALIVLLVLGAALASALALWSLLRAAPGGRDHSDADYRAARAILEEHGTDSLTPFMLRPDKALQFASAGVQAFRVIGETAVVSSDPVAPGGRAPEVLDRFLQVAHERGWQVVVWAALPRSILRVLQAEGYVPGSGDRPAATARRPRRPPLTGSIPARSAR